MTAKILVILLICTLAVAGIELLWWLCEYLIEKVINAINR